MRSGGEVSTVPDLRALLTSLYARRWTKGLLRGLQVSPYHWTGLTCRSFTVLPLTYVSCPYRIVHRTVGLLSPTYRQNLFTPFSVYPKLLQTLSRVHDLHGGFLRHVGPSWTRFSPVVSPVCLCFYPSPLTPSLSPTYPPVLFRYCY